MEKSGNPSTRKPRKKRKSINFMTAKDKGRSKVQRSSPSIKSLASHTNESSLPSTSKMDKSKGSTPKKSRAMQQENDPENSPPSLSKENSVDISTSGKNKTGNNITNTAQSQSKAKPKSHRFKSPGKVQQNTSPDTNTQTKKRKRKPINFIAAKDKRSTIHHQSITGHTLTRGNNNTNTSSTSSISKLSDTPGQLVGRLDSQSSASLRESTSSAGRPRTGQKRKLTGDKVQQATPGRQVKKRKQSKTENKQTPPNTSFTSIISSTSGRVQSRRTSTHVALDRIKDLKVTKKAFEKWKPISKATIGFVEAILKSVVLNVSAEANLKNDQEAAACLTKLKIKVMERLPTLKAPYTNGDYGKMESQNKMAEDVYLEKSRELNVLEKKLEEEQRLLDKQSSMVAEFTKKLENYENEHETLEREKAHPLIQQTGNVLNLPQLPDDFFIKDEASVEESVEERNLCKTLLQLRKNTNEVGLEKWMDKLTDFATSTHAH